MIGPSLVSAAIACQLFAAAAAAPQQAPEVIAEIRIHGNHVSTDAEVIALSGIAVGAPFTATTIAEIKTRLDRAGRFQDVDVLKRYASIADPSQIVVVIVVNEGPVRIDVPDDPDEPIRIVKRRGLRNLMYMPILTAEDGYGLTYGVRLALVNFAGERSRLSFPLSWGGLKQAGAEFDRTFAGGPLSRVIFGGSLREQTNPAFEIDDGRRQVWARAERNYGYLRGGATTGWQHVSFAQIDDSLTTFGADVAFDTRRDPLLPRNAVWLSASWEHVAYDSGGDVDRSRLEGRGYVGLWRQMTLELRAARRDSSDPVPPYLKYLLGGWSSLRGFKAGQFFGDTVVTGTAELRIPLTSALSVGKIGVSAFVDTGTAYDKGQRFEDATLRTGIGGSVWMAIASFQMNLSVAHGRGDKTRVNFGGGFMF